MKIAVIGAGNMGGATAVGLAKYYPGDISMTVTAKHASTLEKYARMGFNCTLDNISAAADADVVIIGVKPWLAEGIIKELKPVLKDKVVLSLVAGISNETLRNWLEGSNVTAAYTVIPNLAIEVGESMTFFSEIIGDENAQKRVKEMFDSVGKTCFVNEKGLDAGMMTASCGTAFALRYARASMEGAISLGLYPAQALEAVLQTMVGAAKLIESHKSHPEQEIDRVTTPGGITIKGLNAMEEAGFTNAVIKGLTSYKK